MKKTFGATNMLFPLPAALVVSGTGEKANIMTVAWLSMLSPQPPRIGLAIAPSRYTHELIRESGGFTVNLPSVWDVKKVDYCGIVSGRKVNKFQECGFTAIAGSKGDIPIIAECPFNLECRVVEEVDLGGHSFFIGEILETHADADKLKDVAGKELPDMAAMDILAYSSQLREYWSMGEKIGDAFSIGKR